MIQLDGPNMRSGQKLFRKQHFFIVITGLVNKTIYTEPKNLCWRENLNINGNFHCLSRILAPCHQEDMFEEFQSITLSKHIIFTEYYMMKPRTAKSILLSRWLF